MYASGSRCARREINSSNAAAKRRRFELVTRGEDLCGVPPEHGLGEQARRKSGFVVLDPGPEKAMPPFRNPRVDRRHDSSVASLSFSDWKWVLTASSISLKSPFRTSVRR